MKTLLTADSLLLPTGTLNRPFVLVEDDRIAGFGSQNDAPLPAAEAHHSFPGMTLAPAFFDVHIHGCRNHDLMEGTPQAFHTANSFLARHGVGAYLPTTITAPKDVTLRALEGMARELAKEPAPGTARPLGIHFEGPFLSHAKKGAHPEQFLLEPSIEFFDAMWEAAEGRVILMTIAPELPGAIDLIRHATARGVRISIGHSDALAAQAHAGIAAGAVSATHTFNAMRRLDQREPGILGAVLSQDSLFAELICDGLHVDPSVVQVYARAKGADRAILVTDAMAATGMPDGSYKLGELDVRVENGRCIIGENTLAGSTLTMDVAVHNYLRFAGVTLAEASQAASGNPAAMTQLGSSVQGLAPGARADLNILNADGTLAATFLGGQQIAR